MSSGANPCLRWFACVATAACPTACPSAGAGVANRCSDTIKPWCVDVAGALERARARVYQSVCWAVEPRVNPVQYKILVYFHIGPISASILVVGGKFGGPAR